MPEALKPSVNSWLEDELYQQYLYDRKTVDPTWNKVFETNGHTVEAHTLVAHEHKDPMKVFFVVQGPLIWLDENGESAGHFDVHDYIKLCRAHFEKVGLGADSVKTLFR